MIVSEELARRLAAWADSQSEILAMYLFGSVAEGRANALSDLDIALLADRDLPKQHLWRLEDHWAAEWPEWVDLHVLNLAPPEAQFEIITRGRRVWVKVLEQVADFESLVRRRYWDLEPLLEQTWKAFERHLWEERNDAEREEYQVALAKVRAVHRRIKETSEA
jgi:predicted nucleotidyltransferase